MNINEIINNCEGIKNSCFKEIWIDLKNESTLNYVWESRKYLEIKSKDIRYVKYIYKEREKYM